MIGAKTEQRRSPSFDKPHRVMDVGYGRRYTADVKSEFLLDKYRSVRSWWNEWTVNGGW